MNLKIECIYKKNKNNSYKYIYSICPKRIEILYKYI